MKMDLQQLSVQYLNGAAIKAVRIVQLEHLLARTEAIELRRRLQHRIGNLRAMMGDERRTGYELAHYYDDEGKKWPSV